MSISEAWQLLAQNWPTVIGALVVGFGGGTIAALITARASASREQATRRAEAHGALKSLERALVDLGMEMEAAVLQDETVTFTKTKIQGVARARELAYPHAHYLPEEKRELVTKQWYSDSFYGDPMGPSDEIWHRGKALGIAIDQAFKGRL